MSRKQSSSAPCGVVARRDLDGIAGVDEVDELDALHDAAGLHVETRDDAAARGSSATDLTATAERVLERDRAGVERAADDQRPRCRPPRARRPRDVREAADAARRDRRGSARRGATCAVSSTFGPLLGAVARDVGVDDRGGAARRAIVRREVRRRDRRAFLPARHARDAVARVDADRRCGRERRGRAAAQSSGSRTATVPTIARAAPASSTRAHGRFVAEPAARPAPGIVDGAGRCARPRRPAPGAPARAPSRSTTWSQRAPPPRQRRAIATGSSP